MLKKTFLNLRNIYYMIFLNQHELKFIQNVKNLDLRNVSSKNIVVVNLQKNYFTLSLSLNGKIIEELDFPADKYNPKTLIETRTYFLMTDLKKKVLETYAEKEKEIQNQNKEEQVNKLWKNFENEK